jgi:hypothetical protein
VATDPNVAATADTLEAGAKALLVESDAEWVTGDAVARAVDLDPDDEDVHNGFRELRKRGKLVLSEWPDGKKLPRLSL